MDSMSKDSENALLLRNKVEQKQEPESQKADHDTSGSNCWERFLRARPLLVEPAFLIYNLANRPAIAVHDQFVNSLVEESYQNATTGNSSECGGGDEVDDDIQAEASMWLLYCNLARTLPAIFVTLIVVSYGDVGGRRLGLVLSNVGSAARFLVYVMVINKDLDVSWVVFGCFLEGICGTHSAITASAYSYIADVVGPGAEKKRTFRFALVHSTTFIAGAIGNLTVGYVLDAFGYLPLFWCFVVIHIIGILYILILLPESNPRQEGASFSVIEAFRKTISSFKVYFKERPEQPDARLLLGLLFAAQAVHSIPALGSMDVGTMYMLAEPFCFDSVLLGYYISLNASCMTLADVLGVPVLRRLGLADVTLGIISGISGVCSSTFQAFSISTAMLFCVPVIGFFNCVAMPIILVMMSKIVDAHEQGALMGNLHSMFTVSELVSFTLLDAVYGATVYSFNGAVFLLIAGLFAIVAILLLIVMGIQKGWFKGQQQESLASITANGSY